MSRNGREPPPATPVSTDGPPMRCCHVGAAVQDSANRWVKKRRRTAPLLRRRSRWLIAGPAPPHRRRRRTRVCRPRRQRRIAVATLLRQRSGLGAATHHDATGSGVTPVGKSAGDGARLFMGADPYHAARRELQAPVRLAAAFAAGRCAPACPRTGWRPRTSPAWCSSRPSTSATNCASAMATPIWHLPPGPASGCFCGQHGVSRPRTVADPERLVSRSVTASYAATESPQNLRAIRSRIEGLTSAVRAAKAADERVTPAAPGLLRYASRRDHHAPQRSGTCCRPSVFGARPPLP